MMTEDKGIDESNSAEPNSARKVYSAPEIVVHGTIQDLTLGISGRPEYGTVTGSTFDALS